MKADSKGHRQRLWQRLEEAGFRQGFVHDYEKLEFLLTFVIAQKDTKPMAKALIHRFGSLNDVIHAPVERLQEVPGIGPKTAMYLKVLHELMLSLDEYELKRSDLLNHPDAVKAYLRRELAWEEAEYLVALYLNTENRLLKKGRMFRGTVNHVAHYPRELAKEALACNAARVLIAHNHPSGRPEPSAEDVRATRDIAAALKLVGVSLLDHFIVGPHEVTSLRERGLMP